jgi:hypothetical protein
MRLRDRVDALHIHKDLTLLFVAERREEELCVSSPCVIVCVCVCVCKPSVIILPWSMGWTSLDLGEGTSNVELSGG